MNQRSGTQRCSSATQSVPMKPRGAIIDYPLRLGTRSIISPKALGEKILARRMSAMRRYCCKSLAAHFGARLFQAC